MGSFSEGRYHLTPVISQKKRSRRSNLKLDNSHSGFIFNKLVYAELVEATHASVFLRFCFRQIHHLQRSSLVKSKNCLAGNQARRFYFNKTIITQLSNYIRKSGLYSVRLSGSRLSPSASSVTTPSN